VVELGCGAGANLWIMRKRHGGNYVGVDARQAQIEAARRRARDLDIDNAEFHLADAAETGLMAGDFDALVAEGRVTSQELDQALREADSVETELFICHIMRQADATRRKPRPAIP